MEEGMPLIRCSGKDQSQEASQEKDEEPPGGWSPIKTSVHIDNFLSQPAQQAVILPFTGKRTPKTSSQTRTFRRKFYPAVSDKDWNNWHWQINNRIRSVLQLERYINLSEEERNAVRSLTAKLPVGITPYFLSLLDVDDSHSPLRRTVVPTIHELFKTPEEADDPLGEEHQSPIPGLVHRYPDRVLLLALDFCSTYCRYCTRSRVVGRGALYPNRSRLERAFAYIEANKQIRDVLISGGDPLTLSDDRLNWILTNLRKIPHVDIIRIGTKVPAVLPQRITPQLVRMLRRHHPLWMSLHFTHPDECTPEAQRACAMLADGGIPLGSQTVLLSGINDSVDIMRDLVHNLMRMRVKPYYLYQCDPISGSSHFRTPVEKGLEIIRGLRGFTSGYAVPTYVIDAPGGGGKIPLMPNYLIGTEESAWVLENYEGKQYLYPDSKGGTPGSLGHGKILHSDA